jgi:hypothetical protein
MDAGDEKGAKHGREQDQADPSEPERSSRASRVSNAAKTLTSSPRKSSLVLYLGPGLHDSALMQRLGKHKATKGCLYINKLDDVDRDVLRELVSSSVAEMRRRVAV